MVFPSDRNLKAQITFDTASASGFVTGTGNKMIVPLTEDHLPPEMLTPGDPQSAQADGFDIAISLDEFGTTRIPLWVRRWVPDATPSNRSALLQIVIDLAPETAQSIYIWWQGETTFTEEPPASEFGRYTLMGGTGANEAGATLYLPFNDDPQGTAPQYVDATGGGFDIQNFGTGVVSRPGEGPRGTPAIQTSGGTRLVSPTTRVLGGSGNAYSVMLCVWVQDSTGGGGGATPWQIQTGTGQFDSGTNRIQFVSYSGDPATTFSIIDNAQSGDTRNVSNVPITTGEPAHYMRTYDGANRYTSVTFGTIDDFEDETTVDQQSGNWRFGFRFDSGVMPPWSEFILFEGIEKPASFQGVYRNLWCGLDISGFASAGAIQLTAVQRTLTLTDCPLDTRVGLFLPDGVGGSGGTLIDSIESTTTANPQLTYTVTTTVDVILIMVNLTAVPVFLSLTLDTNSTFVPAGALLRSDPVFENPE